MNTKNPRPAPGIIPAPLICDILRQDHVLIGGATGSGKSVLLDGIISGIAGAYPATVKLILCDPKIVSFAKWRDLPHVLRHETAPRGIASALRFSEEVITSRYQELSRRSAEKWSGPPLYIIIDELADLMISNPAETVPRLQRIAQIGRAAGVKLIVATQRPTTEIIPARIRVNLTAAVALRCRSPQDSRNIISIPGAELLPRYGFGIYDTPDKTRPIRVQIPAPDPENVKIILDYWKKS